MYQMSFQEKMILGVMVEKGLDGDFAELLE